MPMSNPKSTRRTLAAIVLSFQSFVVFFATLAAYGLQVAPAEWVWTIGLGLALLCIVTPGLLRHRGGYWFGWLLQFAILGTGFWLWGMFFVGFIFLGLWTWAMIAGGTIDRARANYERSKQESESDDDSN
jgi:hypothetical protein